MAMLVGFEVGSTNIVRVLHTNEPPGSNEDGNDGEKEDEAHIDMLVEHQWQHEVQLLQIPSEAVDDPSRWCCVEVGHWGSLVGGPGRWLGYLGLRRTQGLRQCMPTPCRIVVLLLCLRRILDLQEPHMAAVQPRAS